MKTVVLLLLATLIPAAGFAQAPDVEPVPAQLFERLKGLGGTWKGAITTQPAIPQTAGDSMRVTMRVTSLGNAIYHNMVSPRMDENHHIEEWTYALPDGASIRARFDLLRVASAN